MELSRQEWSLSLFGCLWRPWPLSLGIETDVLKLLAASTPIPASKSRATTVSCEGLMAASCLHAHKAEALCLELLVKWLRAEPTDCISGSTGWSPAILLMNCGYRATPRFLVGSKVVPSCWDCPWKKATDFDLLSRIF